MKRGMNSITFSPNNIFENSESPLKFLKKILLILSLDLRLRSLSHIFYF